jgi:hypothetical protein
MSYDDEELQASYIAQHTPNENVLLPCPFCGSKGAARYSDGGLWGVARCTKNGCGVQQIAYKNLNRAIELWNTRTVKAVQS